MERVYSYVRLGASDHVALYAFYGRTKRPGENPNFVFAKTFDLLGSGDGVRVGVGRGARTTIYDRAILDTVFSELDDTDQSYDSRTKTDGKISHDARRSRDLLDVVIHVNSGA